MRQGDTHGFESFPSKQANVDPKLLTFPDVEEDNTTDFPRRRRIKSSLSILASSHGGFGISLSLVYFLFSSLARKIKGYRLNRTWKRLEQWGRRLGVDPFQGELPWRTRGRWVNRRCGWAGGEGEGRVLCATNESSPWPLDLKPYVGEMEESPLWDSSLTRWYCHPPGYLRYVLAGSRWVPSRKPARPVTHRQMLAPEDLPVLYWITHPPPTCLFWFQVPPSRPSAKQLVNEKGELSACEKDLIMGPAGWTCMCPRWTDGWIRGTREAERRAVSFDPDRLNRWHRGRSEQDGY